MVGGASFSSWHPCFAVIIEGIGSRRFRLSMVQGVVFGLTVFVHFLQGVGPSANVALR